MDDSLDILNIDNTIRSNFIKQHQNIEIYKERLSDIQQSLKNAQLHPKTVLNLEKTRDYLSKYIEDIVNEIQYNFYILKSVDLIEEYKKILNQPVKISFLGKPLKITKKNLE